MLYDLVTFGEAMVRLTAPAHQRLEQAERLDVSVGGAEWNVAVNAARLGLRTAWVSRLVDTWAGRRIAADARAHGVDVSNVVWVPFDGVGHVRNGFYHLETGAGPRPSAVTYDRGHSAVSRMTPDMVDWKDLLAKARWLHVSGITPALSESLAETVVAAFRAAGECGAGTSYDLNYRGKLWSPQRAQEANTRIVPHVRVLFGNEEDFEKCLGIRAAAAGQDYSAVSADSYRDVVAQAVGRFGSLRLVGATLRRARTALRNDWQTLLYDGERLHVSRCYEDLEIVDRVGGGDSFSAGVLYGLLSDWPGDKTNDFAAAYSALAHTFPGDINWATAEEALKAMTAASARISR